MWELEEALKGLPTHKSPGFDGLPYEFYVKLRPLLGPSLLKVFRAILERDRLPSTMCQGVTRLIPKVDTVPLASELRPITMVTINFSLESL